jgi:hypothetical protein
MLRGICHLHKVRMMGYEEKCLAILVTLPIQVTQKWTRLNLLPPGDYLILSGSFGGLGFTVIAKIDCPYLSAIFHWFMCLPMLWSAVQSGMTRLESCPRFQSRYTYLEYVLLLFCVGIPYCPPYTLVTDSVHYTVTYRPIARQRLDKHLPAETDSW